MGGVTHRKGEGHPFPSPLGSGPQAHASPQQHLTSPLGHHLMGPGPPHPRTSP